MGIIDRFKNGEIGRDELLKNIEKNPELRQEALALLNKGQELSDSDLDGIVGGSEIHGSANRDRLYGTSGDDTMYGGAGNDYLDGNAGDDHLYGGEGNDKLYGDQGSDTLFGGSGNDTLDGGLKDGADDYASGGSGDDTYIWGSSKDGSDVFDGGSGNDTIKLDLNTLSTNYGNLQQAFDDGAFTLQLTDENGNPVEITDAMWDNSGNLHLPEGCTGIITGQDGDTLTFNDVENIKLY